MSDPDSTTPLKTCSSCGHEYPATTEYFYFKKGGRYGVTGQCRECRKKSDSAYYRAHAEERKAYARVQSKAYYQEHREQVLERTRAYQRDHPEQYREYAKRRDPEATRDYQRLWVEKNRDKHNAKARRRRALEAGAVGTHTAADVGDQLVRQRGRCFYCHSKLGDKYHVEHVTPLSLGGTNGPENLVIACADCNLKKSSKHPMDFAGILF